MDVPLHSILATNEGWAEFGLLQIGAMAFLLHLTDNLGGGDLRLDPEMLELDIEPFHPADKAILRDVLNRCFVKRSDGYLRPINPDLRLAIQEIAR